MSLRSILVGAVLGIIGYWITGRRIDEMGANARRRQLLALAILFPIGLLLSQFVISPIIDPLIEARNKQQAISYQQQRIKEIMARDPVMVQLAVTAPEQTDRIRTALENAAAQGKSEEEIDALLGELGTTVLRQYLANSDNDLAEAMGLYLNAIQDAMFMDSNVCYDITYAPEKAMPVMAKVLTINKQAANRLNTLYVQAIRENRPLVKTNLAQANVDADKIISTLRPKHNAVLALLDKPDALSNDKAKLCSFLTEYYDAVLALPTPNAANLFRANFGITGADEEPVTCDTPYCI
jgi:hypothetical protein